MLRVPKEQDGSWHGRWVASLCVLCAEYALLGEYDLLLVPNFLDFAAVLCVADEFLNFRL